MYVSYVQTDERNLSFPCSFEQIVDDRYHKKSLILSSQLAIADWYGIFSNEMLAEACLDRIVHKSLRFELKGDSMRKKY